MTLQWYLSVDGQDDIQKPTMDDLRAACAAVRDGDADFFVAARRTADDEFIQSSGPAGDDLDTWSVEHADSTGHYVGEVAAAAVPGLVDQWATRADGWAEGIDWRPLALEELQRLEPTDSEILQLPELALPPGTALEHLLEWPFVYIEADGSLVADTDAISDIDLLAGPSRPVTVDGERNRRWSDLARVGTAHVVRTRTLLHPAHRAAIERLVSDPTYLLGDRFDYVVEDFQEMLHFARSLKDIYERRVGGPLDERAKKLAAAVFADESFDHLEHERTSTLVRDLTSNEEPRVARLIERRLRRLVEKAGLQERDEARAAMTAADYLGSLSPAERDRLGMSSSAELRRSIEAAYAELGHARAGLVAQQVSRSLDPQRSERELRYATVARALLAAGVSKKDAAALLGIDQRKMSMAVREAPEDVCLEADDHLRTVGPDVVRLVPGCPSPAEVLRAREHQSNAKRDMQSNARAEIPALVATALAELGAEELDRFPLMTHEDRQRRISEILPAVPAAVVENVSMEVGAKLRISATWEERARRYGVAVNALRARGATLKQARDHLGISPHAEASGRRMAGPDARLANLPADDLLQGIVARYEP
ncbi:hypothetical protein [Nocardioides ultimimeridianus]